MSFSRLLLAGMAVAYPPLILLLIVALCYLGFTFSRYAFTTEAPRFALVPYFAVVADVAILGVSLLLVLGLIPLFLREVDERGGGIPLDPQKHRTFFELLHRISSRMKVKPPDRVYLNPLDSAGIGDLVVQETDGRLVRLRVLWIGAGLIIRVRADELMTILCHEMAHAAAGDTRCSRFTSRFFNSMGFSLALQRDEKYERDMLDRIVSWILLGYLHLFTLAFLHEKRQREYRADRMAAEICGPQNTRNMLMRAVLPTYLPQLSLELLFAEFFQNERHIDNIYEEHRRRWADISPKEIQMAENLMFLVKHNKWSTHPSLTHRMRNLQHASQRELVIDKPAHRPFFRLGVARTTTDPRIDRMGTPAICPSSQSSGPRTPSDHATIDATAREDP